MALAPGRAVAGARMTPRADRSVCIGFHEQLENSRGDAAKQIALSVLLREARTGPWWSLVIGVCAWAAVDVAKLPLDHPPRWPPESTPDVPVKLHHVLGRYSLPA